ncbi:unnamed protein product, partial [marine sediment metagenome]
MCKFSLQIQGLVTGLTNWGVKAKNLYSHYLRGKNFFLSVSFCTFNDLAEDTHEVTAPDFPDMLLGIATANK